MTVITIKTIKTLDFSRVFFCLCCIGKNSYSFLLSAQSARLPPSSEYPVQAAGAGVALAGIGKGASAAQSEYMRQKEIEAQKKVPDHISGQSSSNSMQGIDRNMGGYMRIGLQRQSAERLDQFFDVFGYQIDQLMTPIISGRKAWNYIKTVGANMGGNIPSDRLGFLNNSLDAGVTFWHTTDVGNYGLDNTL